MTTTKHARFQSIRKRGIYNAACGLCLALGLSTAAFSQSLGLEQAIKEVCTNSDSVKMMQQSLEKSDQQVREKRANALPVISGTAYAGKSYGSALGGSSGGGSSSQRSLAKSQASPDAPVTENEVKGIVGEMLAGMFDGISDPQKSTIYSSNISVTQPIYTFGKVGTAIKVAKEFNQSAKYSYSRNLQTLQLAALDAFYRTLLAEKAAEISGRSLTRKKELYDFLDRNFQLGAGSKAQVLATKADYINQSATTLTVKEAAVTAHMALNAFIGRPLTDSSALDTVNILTGLAATPIPSPDDAIKNALETRTDLKSIRLMAESTKGGAKIFKSMYLPTIAATASAGYSKYESGSKLMANDGMPNYSAGVVASWTFFDGFAASAKAAQFLSDARKLDVAANSISKMVEIEIRSAIAECFAADSNLSGSREIYNSAKESYELYSGNFKQGSGQLTELQNSEEQLMNAEFGLFNAGYRQTRSRAALQVAMGKDIVKINEER
jgi:HAE1 family hydrophobic/amphiphilic exporter-1